MTSGAVPALQALELTRRFGGLAALDRVSLSVPAGSITGLIGPNGAGKTTLVNLVTGHDRPTGGRVLVDGRDLTGARPWAFARAGVARTFQVAKPFRDMTVLANVAVGAMHGSPRRTVAEAHARAEAVLEQVGLSPRAGARPGQLAVADGRSLELARALALSPRVLVVDEVLAGLRPAELDSACELITSVRDSGVTVLMVEHVMRAVVAVCDQVLVRSEGRQLAFGPPEAVMSEPAVIEAYLGRGYADRARAREARGARGPGGVPREARGPGGVPREEG